MKKIGRSLRKNIWREIRSTLGRFVAIFAISALGAGFFAGLRATSPDMMATADLYYSHQQLADFRLLSTMGFTQADVEALRQKDSTASVMAGWALDVLADYPEGVQAIHMAALPTDTSQDNPEFLNRPVVEEGRLPQQANECLVDDSSHWKLGDTIRISDENEEDVLDLLAVRELTVVGRGRSVAYVALQRGNTNIGNGRIAYFIYTTPAAFDSEYYTQILLTTTGAKGLSSFSDAYEKLIENERLKLKGFGQERARIRYEDIRQEAQQELDDAKQELNDAIQKLKDGRAEAKEKLDEAWQKILDGKAKIRDGRAEIAKGQAEIDSNQQKLADARRQADEGAAQLAQGRAELQENQRTFDEAYAIFLVEKDNYNKAAAEAAQMEAQVVALANGAAQMEQLLPYVATDPDSDAAFQALAAGSAAGLRQMAAALTAAGYDATQLVAAADGMDAAMLAGQVGYPMALDALKQAVAGLEATVADMQAKLAAGLAQLQAAEQQLAAGRAQLQAGWAQLSQGEADLADARRQIDEGQRLLDAAKVEIADARRQLAKAERELADGKAEYYEEKAKAEQELADAQEKIDEGQTKLDDGQRELNRLEEPEWFVLERTDNPGYSGFVSDTGRIDALALAIPVFFFLVAALVCLTTMTRMVEEQRTLIGTLKALGYSPAAIAFKYLLYAALASATGAVLGVLGGFVAFPSTIWQAYGMMYKMPPIELWGNWGLAVLSVLASVLTTTAATLAACWKELRSVPAGLMRPKAPRAGKRVVLEYITLLWRHMSFMQKVTARNLLRYKKRFFMTVIGVAGCSALLVTGFGLRDSITGIVGRQYGDINLYDVLAVLKDPSGTEADTPLNQLLPTLGQGLYTADTLVEVTSGAASSEDMTIYVFVAEKPEELESFIRFRNRKTGEAIAFPQQEGGVITEKLADRLKVKPGDQITVNRSGGSPAPLTVAAVTENYVFNYIFVTPQQYQELFDEAPQYKQVLINLKEGVAGGEETLTALLNAKPVAGAQDIATLKAEMDDMFSSLNSVVWLIIASAGMLAFVVLYNLTNINITERSREIATLKVLGFYNKEVASYVFRENLILTLIGAMVGLVLGIFLHDFVITTAEIDEVMFRRIIEPLSYVWSVLFTMLSAFIVNLVMTRRLHKINMVESLKANE